MPSARRLSALVDALSGAPVSSLAINVDAVPSSGAEASVASATAAAAPEEPPRLLTLAQLRQFTRDGFITLQIGDLPGSLHTSIYDAAFALEGDAEAPAKGGTMWLRRGEEDEDDQGDDDKPKTGLSVSVAQSKLKRGQDTSGWRALGPAFAELMNSATVRGAAMTICGADYVASEPNPAPQPIGVVDRTLDQQWHKDMTAFGVREHCPRQISAWYYPCDTLVEMGPTAVIPSSRESPGPRTLRAGS
jgi:hypothetical protein